MSADQSRITSRRMLALRARLHEARVWRAQVLAYVVDMTARTRRARALLAASEAADYDEVVAIDRATVGRLVRALDAWREELDAAVEAERRINTAIENATFAQGLIASRESADA